MRLVLTLNDGKSVVCEDVEDLFFCARQPETLKGPTDQPVTELRTRSWSWTTPAGNREILKELRQAVAELEERERAAQRQPQEPAGGSR